LHCKPFPIVINSSAEFRAVASRDGSGDVEKGLAKSKRFFFVKKKQKTFL
jgi:hypothetical protein